MGHNFLNNNTTAKTLQTIGMKQDIIQDQFMMMVLKNQRTKREVIVKCVRQLYNLKSMIIMTIAKHMLV